MQKLTRKAFLQKVGLTGFGLIGVSQLLNSCGNDQPGARSKPPSRTTPPKAANKPKPAANDPCTDVSALTDPEKNIRKSLQYVGQSPDPAKLCDNCELWIPQEAGSSCGGCQVIKGPINPKGYCIQWVAMIEK